MGIFVLASNGGGKTDSGPVTQVKRPLAFDLGKNDPKSWNQLKKEIWDPMLVPEDLNFDANVFGYLKALTHRYAKTIAKRQKHLFTKEHLTKK